MSYMIPVSKNAEHHLLLMILVKMCPGSAEIQPPFFHVQNTHLYFYLTSLHQGEITSKNHFYDFTFLLLNPFVCVY